MSPYLFLICSEGFLALMKVAEEEGRLQEVSICATASSISHLLFADDSLLLLKVDEKNANHLQHVLQLYEACSGQMINKEKSSILFSKNTRPQDRTQFMEILDLSQEAMNARYLGLPVYLGNSKTKLFGYLKERVWKRIQGWKEKLLSNGRE
jgi:hypothetical protein